MPRKIARETLTLLEDAPLPNLFALLQAELPELPVPRPGKGDEAQARTMVGDALDGRGEIERRKFDDIAQRIAKLGHGPGHDSLERIIRIERLSKLPEFEKQLNPLGASIWTWLNDRAAFENAESYQYANHFRNFGRLFAAFEVAPSPSSDLELEESTAEELKERIRGELDLEGTITVSHLRIDDEARGEPAHLLIVRHGGSPASVAQFREDGVRDHHYYRPPNEVTLVFLPRRGMVEVCGPSPAFRVDVAASFAEVVLGQDLSNRPLAHRLYNLERFRQSLKLPFYQPDGFRVDGVSVVDVEVRPGHEYHRITLKVAPEDDIEAAAERHFGSLSLFRSAAAFTRVVVAVRFRPEGAKRSKTLNITLSGQNNSNLRSEPNPEYRRLGYELLEHWGIMQKLKAPTPTDVRELLPMLLELYDSCREKMTEQGLITRELDVNSLAAAGFLVPCGFEPEALIDDDDDGADVVEVEPVRRDTAIEMMDARGRSYLSPPQLSRLFRVEDAWIEEAIVKQLLPALDTKALHRIDPCLVSLGAVEVEGQSLDCLLGRQLGVMKVAKRLDTHLRTERRAGIVLNAGDGGPDYLGARLVVSLPDLLRVLPPDERLDGKSLLLAYRQTRLRAEGGTVVELREHSDDIATLLIPGKERLPLFGTNHLTIFRRLVEAHHEGRPAVRSRDLMEGMKAASPSQAFQNWHEIEGIYILKVGLRDGWKLAA